MLGAVAVTLLLSLPRACSSSLGFWRGVREPCPACSAAGSGSTIADTRLSKLRQHCRFSVLYTAALTFRPWLC